MTSLWTRAGLTWRQLGWRLLRQIYEDELLGRCAELAYFFLFSVFPLLLFLTTLLGYLAEALALKGAVAEGLQTLATALATAEASGAHWADAELHCLRGNLLGRLPSADWKEVEISLRRALTVAREQGSRGFELRAAVDLARLLSAQQRQAEARALLAPVYGWFTEGFDTPDLKEARALLEALDP